MCEHDPIEQIRGQMGQGDYFDAVTNSLDEAKHARLTDNYHLDVYVDDDNRSDRRIICRKCFLSTGWMKIDFVGAPAGIGIPGLAAKWSEIKHHDPESYNALLRASGRKTTLANFGDK